MSQATCVSWSVVASQVGEGKYPEGKYPDVPLQVGEVALRSLHHLPEFFSLNCPLLSSWDWNVGSTNSQWRNHWDLVRNLQTQRIRNVGVREVKNTCWIQTNQKSTFTLHNFDWSFTLRAGKGIPVLQPSWSFPSSSTKVTASDLFPSAISTVSRCLADTAVLCSLAFLPQEPTVFQRDDTLPLWRQPAATIFSSLPMVYFGSRFPLQLWLQFAFGEYRFRKRRYLTELTIIVFKWLERWWKFQSVLVLVD